MKGNNSNYGLVERLKALRELLRLEGFTKTEICRHLPDHYQADPAGDRRLGRDIRALRQLGYEVDVDPSTHVYTLKEISHLALSDNDVQALALLRDSFAALPPISQDVLPVLDHILSALPEPQRRFFLQPAPLSIRLQPAIDYRPHIKSIRLLETAIVQKRKVRFVYPAYADHRPVVHLGVEPYEVQFFDRHFYLIGVTPQSSEMTEFRIDRIREIELMPARANRQRTRPTLAFTYRLSQRIAQLGISERFLDQEVVLQDDGSALIHARGYSEFRIVQDLLRYGEQAELVGPPELRLRMAQVVQAMAAIYAAN